MSSADDAQLVYALAAAGWPSRRIAVKVYGDPRLKDRVLRLLGSPRAGAGAASRSRVDRWTGGHPLSTREAHATIALRGRRGGRRRGRESNPRPHSSRALDARANLRVSSDRSTERRSWSLVGPRFSLPASLFQLNAST
jgi:hypothetical protein